MATTSILIAEVSDATAASAMLVGAGGRIALEDARLVAHFSSATEAVLAAVALHRAGVAMRVAVDAGDDPAATVAACTAFAGEAWDGSILVSEVVRLLVAPGASIEFLEVPGSEVTWEVAWADADRSDPIPTVVAEDSVLVRAGIVALLREEGFDVVAEVGDQESLLNAARALRPRLVVTDVRMPPSQSDEGISAAATLRAEDPSVGVLVLSQHVEPAAAALLLANNPTAVGYLLKERVSDLDDFARACRVVASGGVVIDPIVIEQLLVSRPEDALQRLTDREREVLDHMAQGRSNAAIAREVHCSIKTLEVHIRSIFAKLDLPEDPDDHRRVAAVVRYLHARR